MKKNKKTRFLFAFFLVFNNFAPMNDEINCNGRLFDLSTPRVMGILNATDDSFFADSRCDSEKKIAQRAAQIIAEGGSIIDIGACSTRPGSTAADEQMETERLRTALTIVRRECPQAVVSVDTYRPQVARMAVEEFGAAIINDVGAGAADCTSAENRRMAMFRTVSSLRVPYIYMSRARDIQAVLKDCAEAVSNLRRLGQKDILLDPGFGFGKTVAENYSLLAAMEHLQVLELPLLVGVSRKSMIQHVLDCTAVEALNGTTALNTAALLKGASILRVHDVREAVECVKIVEALQGNNKR